MAKDDYLKLVGRDFGFGPLTVEDAKYHSSWKPASGHPNGWRVVRGVSPMEELQDGRGMPIFFGTYGTASIRAFILQLAEETGESLDVLVAAGFEKSIPGYISEEKSVLQVANCYQSAKRHSASAEMRM